MKFPTLYDKSRVGKLKVWTIESIQNSDNTATIKTVYGYEDGAMQTAEKIIKVGKNIGKSNETTPYQQATSEAQAEWNKKNDKGYKESADCIVDSTKLDFPLPMLAQKFTEREKYISFPAFVQPKLDGVRAMSKKIDGQVYLWSRLGKPFAVPTEIIEELGSTLSEGQMLDGEIYIHGWGFQRTISALKKRNDDTPHLKYFVYDQPHASLTFNERFVKSEIQGGERVQVLSTYPVNDVSEMRELFSLFIQQDFEGLIIRNMNGLYQFKDRSNDLQKVKEFEDAEFEIVGAKEATGKDTGTAVFKCKATNGEIFEARPRGPLEVRQEYWTNLDSYIGKMLTVRYFGFTDSGLPRFPVGIVVRDYE